MSDQGAEEWPEMDPEGNGVVVTAAHYSLARACVMAHDCGGIEPCPIEGGCRAHLFNEAGILKSKLAEAKKNRDGFRERFRAAQADFESVNRACAGRAENVAALVEALQKGRALFTGTETRDVPEADINGWYNTASAALAPFQVKP